MLFDAYVLWPFVKKSFEFVKRISTPDSTVVKKYVNLEYNTLVRWDKWIVDQVPDVPTIIFFSCKIHSRHCFNFFFYFFYKNRNKEFWVP